MSDNTQDMILPLLREIRAEMNRRFDAAETRDDKVETKLDQLESKLDNIRQAAFGESVLGRYAAAEVEERMEKLEKRIAMLEGRS